MSSQLDDLDAPLNPFPGLRPFEPDEDYLFFGRERQTDELLRRLRSTRFLAILGTSGSGKSSLVRSGLIPSLYGGGMTKAGSQWRVAIMRPGEDPLGNLAAALDTPEALGSETDDEGLRRAFFEATLRSSKLGLIECIRQARLGPGVNVLLLVDQFEELFRFKRSRRAAGRDEAVAFVKLLLAARSSEIPCYVAVTMRSDFIGDCMEFGELPEVVNNGIYLVPRMTRDELRSAITGPVAVGGATIAPRLVARLLNDVGDDPDQLPILQHALMRTWDRWENDHRHGEPVDLRHYEAIGTMRTALSRHAEEAFEELDADGKRIAEKLFRALTDKEIDVRGVRRPAALSEICALTGASERKVAAVVETFRKPGRSFLMPPAAVPLHAGSVLDISHESLMRVWEKLSGWADDEARSAQLYRSIAEAAERHERGVAALWRDPELQLALTWRAAEKPTEVWASRYDPSFARAMSFLDASKAERDRDVLEKESRRRRELMRTRAVALIMMVAMVVTAGAGVVAYKQKDQAEAEQYRAEAALSEVQRQEDIAQAQKKRAEALAAKADREKLIALVAQSEAESERANAEHQTLVAREQTAIAELERLNAAAAEKVARDKEKQALAEKLNADVAREKAEQSEKERSRLGYLADARAKALKITKDETATPRGLALELWRLHLENGGRAEDPDIFAAMSSALFAQAAPPVREGARDGIRAVAVSPDGQTALAGTDDGNVLRFHLASNAPPVPVATASSAIRSIAIRPRGDLFAIGTAGGTVLVRNLRNPDAAPRELTIGTSIVSAVAFQPKGSLLAAAALDGSVRMWNVDDASAAPVVVREADGKRVHAIAFSADGKSFVAAGEGAQRWDVSRPTAEPQLVCESTQVRSVAFSPDGSQLACGSREGNVLLERHPFGTITGRLAGHASSVNAVSFDATGELLATASSDGTVRIWDTKDRSGQSSVLAGHTRWVWSAGFTPDGERVVSGSQDRTLRIWPARTKVLAADLCRQGVKGLSQREWDLYMPAGTKYRESPCGAL